MTKRGKETRRRKEVNYEEAYERKIKRRKIIGIAILILLLLLFLVLFLKAYFTDASPIVEVSNNEKTMLSSAKKYYKINYKKMPEVIGDCNTVDLNELLLSNLIEKKNFKNCRGKSTKVKVCKVSEDKIQWTPILECDEIKTEFDEWKEGTLKDLVKNQSDVKFEFKPSKIELSEEDLSEETEEYWQEDVPYDAYKTVGSSDYYRYRDKIYVWNLNKKQYYGGNAYYLNSPASGYDKKDSPKVASKWYKEGSKIYWNNGKFSSTQPDNIYVNKIDGYTVKIYRTRNWIEVSKPYEREPYNVYVCSKEGSNLNIHSLVPCTSQPDGYTKEIQRYSACVGTTPVDPSSKCKACNSGKLKTDRTSCGSYGDWGLYTSTPCVASDTCEVKTKNMFRWYKTDRNYYPSGAKSASVEKAFYTSLSGYIKDSATTTTAYKWYKLVKTGETTTYSDIAPNALATKSSKYKWGNWTSYSISEPTGNINTEVETKTKVRLRKPKEEANEKWKDLSKEYVKQDKLLEIFKDNNYEVDSLKDININGEIKYEIKMFYRNRVGGN